MITILCEVWLITAVIMKMPFVCYVRPDSLLQTYSVVTYLSLSNSIADDEAAVCFESPVQICLTKMHYVTQDTISFDLRFLP